MNPVAPEAFLSALSQRLAEQALLAMEG